MIWSKVIFPGLATDPHIGGVEPPGVADRGVDKRALSAAVRRAMRAFDDRLKLRGRDGKRQHADAVDFDSRNRRVQRASDKEVPGSLDASEQPLKSLQVVIIGNGDPFVDHAREPTGFWRCGQSFGVS
jgi:hypothetical protein